MRWFVRNRASNLVDRGAILRGHIRFTVSNGRTNFRKFSIRLQGPKLFNWLSHEIQNRKYQFVQQKT